MDTMDTENLNPVKEEFTENLEDTESNHSNIIGGKVCCVCGDKALSCNFGAISCESCKAFFRRNAFKNINSKCNGQCLVTVASRSHCKKCRLKKCLAVGMKTDLILSDEQKRMRKQKILENKMKRVGGYGDSDDISPVQGSSFRGHYPHPSNMNPYSSVPQHSFPPGLSQIPGSYGSLSYFGQNNEMNLPPNNFLTSRSDVQIPHPTARYSDTRRSTESSQSYGSEMPWQTHYSNMNNVSPSLDSHGSSNNREPPSPDLPQLNSEMAAHETPLDGHTLPVNGHQSSVILTFGQHYLDNGGRTAEPPLALDTDSKVPNSSNLAFSIVQNMLDELSPKLDSLPPPIVGPSYDGVFKNFYRLPNNECDRFFIDQVQKAASLAFAKKGSDKEPCPACPSMIEMFNFGEGRFQTMIKLAKHLTPFCDLGIDNQVYLLKQTVLTMIVIHSTLTFDPKTREWEVKTPEGEVRRVNANSVKAKQKGAILMYHYEVVATAVLTATRRDLALTMMLLILNLFDIGFVETFVDLTPYEKIVGAYRRYHSILQKYTQCYYPHDPFKLDELLCVIRMAQDFNETYLKALVQTPMEAISPFIKEMFDVGS